MTHCNTIHISQPRFFLRYNEMLKWYENTYERICEIYIDIRYSIWYSVAIVCSIVSKFEIEYSKWNCGEETKNQGKHSIQQCAKELCPRHCQIKHQIPRARQLRSPSWHNELLHQSAPRTLKVHKNETGDYFMLQYFNVMYSKCHWRLAWYSLLRHLSKYLVIVDRFKLSFEATWYSSVPNSLIRMAWLLLGPVCLCADYTRTFTMSVVAKYQLPTYCQLNVYRKESCQAGICREGREVADFLGRSPLQFGVATHWSKRSAGSSQSQDETKQKCSFLGCVVIRKINRTLFILEWVYDMIYVWASAAGEHLKVQETSIVKHSFICC